MKQHKPTARVTKEEPCDGCGTPVSITRFLGGQVAVTTHGKSEKGDPIYRTHRHN